jgi:type I restriction enzyme, R subunit
MTRQSEQVLEDQLLQRLQKLGYEYIPIRDEAELLNNLKTQLEKHNGVNFSDNEFARVLSLLGKGTVFEKAKTLRGKQSIVRDDGTTLWFELLQQKHWCRNRYQVTRQVSVEGLYKNRYDVTILINGLPLAQIELKRTGLELKEAFNQVNRYHRHSYGSGAALFQFVQLFVISNGVNTRYYANNRNQSFKHTFSWTDEKNNRLSNILNGFTDEFLEPCHLSKMICKYIVLSEARKALMVLRPYQYYAVEAIEEKVKNGGANGYVWHTTGSGKTLTSFKASQVLTKLDNVSKVVFVVDRKDLDYQTTIEFNSFSAGSVDGTDSTRELVRQFSDGTKLIVTTIQKLNTAISKLHFQQKMDRMKNEKIVFIFDECHRSQFGETHDRIKNYFTAAQMFGFTGTPILAKNAVRNERGRRTTKELFGERLHEYVITDAIRDENVLRFSVEYVGRYRQKESARTNIDIEVEDIDRKELMDNPARLEKISDYIVRNHARKTHNRTFTAMFCVSSVENLVRYYELLRRKRDEGMHDLRIATIFSYAANEEDAEADDLSTGWKTDGAGVSKHSREKLDEFIAHYNSEFGTKFSTRDPESFYNYYNDISRRVRTGEIDILLVVNMFLTGFDSPQLNTLYVDKNLKHHGLIQAYSRTNRLCGEQKSQGNIVVFRNLKKKTDEAVALFSDKNAQDAIMIEPYENHLEHFAESYEKLKKLAPNEQSVDLLADEDEELEFVKAFREIMKAWNVLKTFRTSAGTTWRWTSRNSKAIKASTSICMIRCDPQTENRRRRFWTISISSWN